MRNELILWADDEIDLLKPHILFLKQKGYEVITVSNGRDALEMSEKEHFDLIILDENMPGLSGLETLSRIKETNPDVPVVMITKNEECKKPKLILLLRSLLKKTMKNGSPQTNIR